MISNAIKAEIATKPDNNIQAAQKAYGQVTLMHVDDRFNT
jgi:hypothetical protein